MCGLHFPLPTHKQQVCMVWFFRRFEKAVFLQIKTEKLIFLCLSHMTSKSQCERRKLSFTQLHSVQTQTIRNCVWSKLEQNGASILCKTGMKTRLISAGD